MDGLGKNSDLDLKPLECTGYKHDALWSWKDLSLNPGSAVL